MEIIATKNVKHANTESLDSLIEWARYYENNPRLDYMKLSRFEGRWFITVVLK